MENRLMRYWVGAVLCVPFLCVYAADVRAAELAVTVDGTSSGRVFEGVGALSAGASSRLLIDYPEPQRSEILDFLFKPNYGANLHHLKVEIGGDVESTDGSEPSHAATREEFLNPRPEYFQRGYEWWLMKEAKKRNPDILLEGLQWGAPGWIGEGKFYSQDNADFIVSFIKGAKNYHGLTMDYQGIWNETLYDTEWIKLLRRTLDSNGLKHVAISAGDLWKPEEKWLIVNDAIRDPALMSSIATFNSHTAHMIGFQTPKSAKDSGKPLWDGEAHAYGGDWYAAANHIRFNLRSYPMGKITKVISWSLITSYHDYLVCPKSGMMQANEPWSGHYEVQPPLWMIAHVNQFAKTGWRYLDGGCQVYEYEGGLREGLSVVSLRAPGDDPNYTVLIESMDAKEPHRLTFTVKGGLATNDVSCWRSVFNGACFERQADIEVRNGQFTLDVLPNAVYSLTTTRGQKKGEAAQPIPQTKPFPFPFREDFEGATLNQPGRYFSDVHGTFMVADRQDGEGRCLKQTITRPGIPWLYNAFSPQTIIGDVTWKDYRIEADLQLPDAGHLVVWSHAKMVNSSTKYILPGVAPKFQGYAFIIEANGVWRLKRMDVQLAEGRVPELKQNWHRVGLEVRNGVISISWDSKTLAEVKDATLKQGVVAFGSGWNPAQFDNLRVYAPSQEIEGRERATGADVLGGQPDHPQQPR
jgi:galactosylceramidase